VSDRLILQRGDLFDIVIENGALQEDIAKSYLKQLLSGLAHCHAQGWAHRDIKAENLLVYAEVPQVFLSIVSLQLGVAACTCALVWYPDRHPCLQGHLKISDFGLSVASPGPTLIKTEFCGTPKYAAPEILRYAPYDPKVADVWSCGVTLYVMLKACFPFGEASYDCDRFLGMAAHGDWSDVLEGLPDGAKSLLRGMLEPDVTNRLTVAEILEHPWVRGDDGESSGAGSHAGMEVADTERPNAHTERCNKGQQCDDDTAEHSGRGDVMPNGSLHAAMPLSARPSSHSYDHLQATTKIARGEPTARRCHTLEECATFAGADRGPVCAHPWARVRNTIVRRRRGSRAGKVIANHTSYTGRLPGPRKHACL
jgi:serine/threonine protein kinase